MNTYIMLWDEEQKWWNATTKWTHHLNCNASRNNHSKQLASSGAFYRRTAELTAAFGDMKEMEMLSFSFHCFRCPLLEWIKWMDRWMDERTNRVVIQSGDYNIIMMRQWMHIHWMHEFEEMHHMLTKKFSSRYIPSIWKNSEKLKRRSCGRWNSSIAFLIIWRLSLKNG